MISCRAWSRKTSPCGKGNKEKRFLSILKHVLRGSVRLIWFSAHSRSVLYKFGSAVRMQGPGEPLPGRAQGCMGGFATILFKWRALWQLWTISAEKVVFRQGWAGNLCPNLMDGARIEPFSPEASD
jgi:hypothetical protein